MPEVPVPVTCKKVSQIVKSIYVPPLRQHLHFAPGIFQGAHCLPEHRVGTPRYSRKCGRHKGVLPKPYQIVSAITCGTDHGVVTHQGSECPLHNLTRQVRDVTPDENHPAESLWKGLFKGILHPLTQIRSALGMEEIGITDPVDNFSPRVWRVMTDDNAIPAFTQRVENVSHEMLVQGYGRAFTQELCQARFYVALRGGLHEEEDAAITDHLKDDCLVMRYPVSLLSKIEFSASLKLRGMAWFPTPNHG